MNPNNDQLGGSLGPIAWEWWDQLDKHNRENLEYRLRSSLQSSLMYPLIIELKDNLRWALEWSPEKP